MVPNLSRWPWMSRGHLAVLGMSFPFPCFLKPGRFQVENRKIPPAVSEHPGHDLGEFCLFFFVSRCAENYGD